MSAKTRLQAAAELLRLGRLAEARTKLLKEVRLAPESAAAVELLGAITFEMGRHDEAIGYLCQAARLAPSSPGPRLNLGKALFEAGRSDEAAEALKDAVGRWPDIPEGHLSYGNVLFDQGKLEQAIEQYRAAIRLAPREAAPYANLALTLSSLRDHEAVCSVCEHLLRLDSNSAPGHLLLAMARQRLCAWNEHEFHLAKAADFVRQGRIVRGMALSSMLFWDDASLHRRCADLTITFYAPRAGIPAAPKLSARKSGRVRVGYVSADFRQHPVAVLIAGFLEGHDRNRFEITAVSLGKDDNSHERQRLMKAFDRFQDMSQISTDAIIRTMREMEIDIAVDLMGYTTDCRPAIFIQRAAPVQVSYLGFPGTSGIPAMDYIIVDPFIADGDLRHWATEKLAILPDCYQCSDAGRLAPPDPPSRSSCDLPEDAFVFASFNQARKLTPEVFDLWMRIMRQVEGSVLWLPKPPGPVETALRGEAERRGVEPSRIIFARRVDSHDLHIARNAVADLHLDTFPYNAHTTASDALRAGSPILTRSGASLPSRVCGSLLTTIGVPELITYSAEEYEALAVRLARDRQMLTRLKRRIKHGRLHSPLFDTALFCRNFERAYEAMIELSRAGKPPTEIDVRKLTGACGGSTTPT